MAEDNSRILSFGCFHAPYNHPDAVRFLEYVASKCDPTRVICMGDEADYHAMSFHESDPELDCPGRELMKARDSFQGLSNLFPTVDVLDSNHGSMPFRKARNAKMPGVFLKSLNEIYGVPMTWKWHNDIVIGEENNKLKFQHYFEANELLGSQRRGMCIVQAHAHTKFGVRYYKFAGGVRWGAFTGCLVDNNSRAMAYNKTWKDEPVLGCLIILYGHPIPVVMELDDKNRWVGYVEWMK